MAELDERHGAPDHDTGADADGYGDDQGTRIGSPDPGEHGRGPAREGGGASTGAGAEAAEGIHSVHGRTPRERSGAEAHDAAQAGDDTRAGSEPLTDAHPAEHRSGYGGDMGAPKTSSDERSGHPR